jgi:hypothetical protein
MLKHKRPSIDMSIGEGRQYVEAHLIERDPGIFCPCCGQYCKLYKRKFNSQMAVWMVWLVREFERRPRWIDWHDAPHTLRGGDYAKAAHWELIRHRENTDTANRTSGYWKPTKKGIDFAYNKLAIPSHVLIFNNEVRGFTKKRITIVQALGNHFNYQELMHA